MLRPALVQLITNTAEQQATSPPVPQTPDVSGLGLVSATACVSSANHEHTAVVGLAPKTLALARAACAHADALRLPHPPLHPCPHAPHPRSASDSSGHLTPGGPHRGARSWLDSSSRTCDAPDVSGLVSAMTCFSSASPERSWRGSSSFELVMHLRY